MPDDNDNDNDVDSGDNEGAANVSTDQDRVDTAEKGDRGEFDVGSDVGGSKGIIDRIGALLNELLSTEEMTTTEKVGRAVASPVALDLVVGLMNAAGKATIEAGGPVEARGASIGSGYGNQTEISGADAGSGMGDNRDDALNNDSISKPPEEEDPKKMFSGKTPYELYQQSLLAHDRFKISIPSIVDFPSASLPRLDDVGKIFTRDPNVIPVHSDDLASPLAAIIKSGQRSLMSQGGGRNG